MPYDLTTITVRPATHGKALPRIEEFLKSFSAKGEFLGCLYSELGALNRILIIHRYDSDSDLNSDRKRIVENSNAYNIGEFITGIMMNTFVMFPFVPALKPGQYGPIFEVRDYLIKPEGLAFTLKAWEAKLPERLKLSPMIGALYAIGGPTLRFVHIWPYPSLDERARIRAKAIETGVWPPPGGPDQLLVMQSEIFLPAAFSPIR
jgi:NIPSNAP protein